MSFKSFKLLFSCFTNGETEAEREGSQVSQPVRSRDSDPGLSESKPQLCLGKSLRVSEAVSSSVH